jgi:hypothetical protein
MGRKGDGGRKRQVEVLGETGDGSVVVMPLLLPPGRGPGATCINVPPPIPSTGHAFPKFSQPTNSRPLTIVSRAP